MDRSRRKLIKQIHHEESSLYEQSNRVLAHKKYLKSFIARQQNLITLLVIPLLWGWRQGKRRRVFHPLLRLMMSSMLMRSADVLRKNLVQAVKRKWV